MQIDYLRLISKVDIILPNDSKKLFRFYYTRKSKPKY